MRDEIAAMDATAQKMRAQGLKIELGNCAERGRQRICVAVQPGAQRWGTDAAPFFILKGPKRAVRNPQVFVASDVLE